jgi:hypothetical protein
MIAINFGNVDKKIKQHLSVLLISHQIQRDYYLGNYKLNRVIIEKDLGILISHNLNWNEHIDFIASKFHRMLNLLYHTCKD